jgi:hypothetical protein
MHENAECSRIEPCKIAAATLHDESAIGLSVLYLQFLPTDSVTRNRIRSIFGVHKDAELFGVA